MVKKVHNDRDGVSPMKDSQSNGMNGMNPYVDGDKSNMGPQTNDAQKPSKVQGGSGSGKTNTDPQIEEERNQTSVNPFDVSNVEGGNGADVPSVSGQNEDDDENDNRSKVSKKSSDYLKFFKFYYDKTKEEHPSWTPAQITTIVSLMWKKKKNHDKNPPSRPVSNSSRRSNKPLGAKQAFKLKHKDLSKVEMDELWSKLPKQSKNFWKSEGDKYGNLSKLSEVSSVNDCRAPLNAKNNMKMLLNQF